MITNHLPAAAPSVWAAPPDSGGVGQDLDPLCFPCEEGRLVETETERLGGQCRCRNNVPPRRVPRVSRAWVKCDSEPGAAAHRSFLLDLFLFGSGLNTLLSFLPLHPAFWPHDIFWDRTFKTYNKALQRGPITSQASGSRGTSLDTGPPRQRPGPPTFPGLSVPGSRACPRPSTTPVWVFAPDEILSPLPHFKSSSRGYFTLRVLG